MRFVVPLLFLLTGVAGFAPAPFPRTERSKPDAPHLMGKWEFVTWKFSGHTVQSTQWIEITPGKTEFIQLANSASRVAYEFRLHPHLSPPAFEWHNGDLEHYVGCYRMEGDRLIMTYKVGTDVKTRPKDLAETNEFYFVLQRKSR